MTFIGFICEKLYVIENQLIIISGG